MAGARKTIGLALAAATALFAAWVLFAAPVFADTKARSGTVQFVNCDRVQVAEIQYSAGNSGDVDQEVNITQVQELDCTGERGRNYGATRAVATGKGEDVLADTIVKGVLPDTGGLSLPALAAYALVVTGIFCIVRPFRGRR